jgi:hypothetical protein
MPGKGDKFAGLDDAMVFDNGETVAFTIQTATGKQMRVNCAVAELGDVFSYLGQIAKAAGEARSVSTLPKPQAHNYLAPVPAQAIGLQAGDRPDETLLVIRLFGFDMAFAVPTSGIVRLADDFVRAGYKLSPGSNQVQ